tara:strand:+ start:230 stop:484 length:255 start_codon:yes stop_codon:yes gene_type:complete
MTFSELDLQDDIHLAQLLVLRSGLKLEIKGLKMRRGKTFYTLIKNRWKVKGSKKSVLEQFEWALSENGITFHNGDGSKLCLVKK